MINKESLELHSGIVNSENNYIFYMSDNDRTLNIEISYLRCISLYGENPYINVIEMEEQLSTIRLPLPINELYKRVVKGLKCNIKILPSVKIKETKKTEKGLIETDYMCIRKGELVELVVTKDNRKVVIKSKGKAKQNNIIDSNHQNENAISLVKKPNKNHS